MKSWEHCNKDEIVDYCSACGGPILENETYLESEFDSEKFCNIDCASYYYQLQEVKPTKEVLLKTKDVDRTGYPWEHYNDDEIVGECSECKCPILIHETYLKSEYDDEIFCNIDCASHYYMLIDKVETKILKPLKQEDD